MKDRSGRLPGRARIIPWSGVPERRLDRGGGGGQAGRMMSPGRLHPPLSAFAARLHGVALALMSLALLPAGAAADVVALLPVKFLDTSGEAPDQSAAHQARLEGFGATLAEKLAAGQDDATIARINAVGVAAACTPETPECLVALARDQGADRALFVVVLKTSTLIMQGFATVVDTRAETVTAQRDLSFRGDTDESWDRAARFLAQDLR